MECATCGDRTIPLQRKCDIPRNERHVPARQKALLWMRCSKQNVSVQLISPVSFHGFLWPLESLKASCFHCTEVVRDLKKVPDFNTVAILSSGKTQRWSLHSGYEWERRAVDGEQQPARGEKREAQGRHGQPQGESCRRRPGWAQAARPSCPGRLRQAQRAQEDWPSRRHIFLKGPQPTVLPQQGWQSSGGWGSPSIPAALSPLPPPLA